jgi:hypothetical protein
MKGYFSLVQYCPDIARREAANIGVVLLCPEAGFLEVKLKSDNRRVRHFFGEEADGYKFLNQMKAALTARIAVSKGDLLTLEALQSFVSTWTSKVMVTNPKPVKVVSPEEDLLALFKELVDEPIADLTTRAAQPLRARLDAVLGAPEMQRFVQRGLKVEVPALKRPLEVPYGYQNGRFNLIVPQDFTQRSDVRIENAACKVAVEGRSLYEHHDPRLGQLQLVVVADFAPDREKARQIVEGIFQEYKVRLFEDNTLPALEEEIRTHAKPLALI